MGRISNLVFLLILFNNLKSQDTSNLKSQDTSNLKNNYPLFLYRLEIHGIEYKTLASELNPTLLEIFKSHPSFYPETKHFIVISKNDLSDFEISKSLPNNKIIYFKKYKISGDIKKEEDIELETDTD